MNFMRFAIVFSLTLCSTFSLIIHPCRPQVYKTQPAVDRYRQCFRREVLWELVQAAYLFQFVSHIENAFAEESDEFNVTFSSGPVGIELGKSLQGPCSVMIRNVREGSKASLNSSIIPGLGISRVGALNVCKGKDPSEVANIIKTAKFPLSITFMSPAKNDRMTDIAATLKKNPLPENASTADSGKLTVTRLTRQKTCGMVSQEGDLIEIRYTARIAEDMHEYDSSDKRGTGQSYAITLGRGDVVRGLDLGLYNMCIGERRKVEVPAGLGYGLSGSKAFGVPPDSNLVFGVQLISINGVANDSVSRGENYYTGDPCNEEAKRAGISSGLCRTTVKELE